MTTKEKLKEYIANLVQEGRDIIMNEVMKGRKVTLEASTSKKAAAGKSNKLGDQQEAKTPPKKSLQDSYQAWYSKVLPVVRQILPERCQEFIELYKLEKRKEIDALTYTISDSQVIFFLQLDADRVPQLKAVVGRHGERLSE